MDVRLGDSDHRVTELMILRKRKRQKNRIKKTGFNKLRESVGKMPWETSKSEKYLKVGSSTNYSNAREDRECSRRSTWVNYKLFQ